MASIAQGVWSMILGLELRPWTGATAPPVPHAVVGSIGITGAWNGGVRLRCPGALARRATAILFGVEPCAATPDQTRDVIGELTNVLAGNLKALLPEPCRLSLPSVGEAEGGPEPAQVLFEVALECEDEPVLVTVLHREGAAPQGPAA